MKKIIFLSAAVLLVNFNSNAQTGSFVGLTDIQPASKNVVPVQKQQISYEIRGSYARSVTKTTLDKAQLLNDFIDGYPTNWIDEYVSVSTLAINNDKEIKAVSMSGVLTKEQKNILKAADLNSDVDIIVKYKAAKTFSGIGEDKSVENSVKTINIRLTVIPETEAKYATGSKAMNTYLKENVINNIPETVASKIKNAKLLFTVNAKGEIEETILLQSSGDTATDQLILKSINNMPKWKPAENSKGEKVKQYFEFFVGFYGC